MIFIHICSSYKKELILTEITGVTPTGRIKTVYQDKVFLSDGREYGRKYSGFGYVRYTLESYDDNNKKLYEKQQAVKMAKTYIKDIGKYQNNLLNLDSEILYETIHNLEKISVLLKGDA